MAAPKLNDAVHIQYYQIAKHFETKYNIVGREYLKYLVDSGRTRGNSVATKFTCSLIDSPCDPEIAMWLQEFVPERLYKILVSDNTDDALELVLKTKPKMFLELYDSFRDAKEDFERCLGEEGEYWWEYILAGCFEAAIISKYKLADYLDYDKYYYQFEW